jgi:hypothetical protein
MNTQSNSRPYREIKREREGEGEKEGDKKREGKKSQWPTQIE